MSEPALLVQEVPSLPGLGFAGSAADPRTRKPEGCVGRADISVVYRNFSEATYSMYLDVKPVKRRCFHVLDVQVCR